MRHDVERMSWASIFSAVVATGVIVAVLAGVAWAWNALRLLQLAA